jgi:hypothetical protein
MAEPATVEFVDQTQRRRKLQLHDVDGQLRVNLTSALANYEAASFTRLMDGLVLEGYKGSDYSAVAFKAGEEVLVEAVSRNAGGSSPRPSEHCFQPRCGRATRPPAERGAASTHMHENGSMMWSLPLSCGEQRDWHPLQTTPCASSCRFGTGHRQAAAGGA